MASATQLLATSANPHRLKRGYKTFGSASGHHKHYLLLPDILNLVNSDFGLNDEERNNFASDSLKKTHDVALNLMQARYDAAPKRMLIHYARVATSALLRQAEVN